MLPKLVSAALLGASAVSAAPVSLPLKNGFPNIKIPSPALTAIEKGAQGTLPNAPLLPSLSAEDVANWQVVSTNEQFEVAFFTSFIQNITSGAFTVPSGMDEDTVVAALRAIRAQEELHALGANAILEAAGQSPIAPCEYMFPSTDFETALDTARQFTDLVVGTLQAVQYIHATTGDAPYIPLIGSVIGQESEQIGFFRQGLGLIPSELPFLTTSTGVFAYSALNQLFLVPGSCPDAGSINVPVLAPLTVVTSPVAAKTQQLEFEFTADSSYTPNFALTYINQQNLPVSVKPTNVKKSGSTVTFSATFPYAEYIMNGMTIAAVTSSAGPFDSATAVTDAALYGPGLIFVN